MGDSHFLNDQKCNPNDEPGAPTSANYNILGSRPPVKKTAVPRRTTIAPEPNTRQRNKSRDLVQQLLCILLVGMPMPMGMPMVWKSHERLCTQIIVYPHKHAVAR